MQVGQPPVDGREVELEVAGVDDHAQRRAQGDAHRVGNRVPDAERRRAEAAQVDRLSGFEGQHRVGRQLVFLELDAEQSLGQRRGIDGHARKVRQHVWQAADVVLVRMRNQEGLEHVLTLAQVGHVGHDEVDAEHLFVGEHQAAIDHDDLVVRFENGHVLADFAHAAEGQDAQRAAICTHLEEPQLRFARRRQDGLLVGDLKRFLGWRGRCARCFCATFARTQQDVRQGGHVLVHRLLQGALP